MHFIWTLIIGAVIGCIGQLIVGRDMPLGWLGNIIGGLVGAWLGTALLGDWGAFIGRNGLDPSYYRGHHRRLPCFLVAGHDSAQGIGGGRI